MKSFSCSLIPRALGLLAVALLLGACATRTPQLAAGDPGETAPAVTAAQPAAANTEIQPFLLYQLLVAEVAAQRGRLDLAVANYLAAAKDSRDRNVAQRATRMALFARNLPAALNAGQLWVELDPDNAEAHKIVAPLLLAAGRVDEAVGHFRRQVALSDALPDRGQMQIALQLMREANQALAQSVMEALLAEHQDDPYAWLAQGQLATAHKNYALALSAVERALALRPHWAPGVILRTQVLSEQGQRARALELLAQEREGALAQDTSVGLAYARLLAEDGQLEAARHEFERLAQLQPRNADLHFAAGVLALQFKDLEQAEQRFQQVLELGQRIPEATYHLGRLYEIRDDNAKAVEYYLGVEGGEYYFESQLRAANLMAKDGEVDGAIEHLHTVRVTDAEQQQRITLLQAELLRNAGRNAEAMALYTERLAHDPTNTALRYARALLAERLDDLALAEADLRDIIEREPTNAQALNALGYTLADRTDRYQEALQYIERALAVEPDDGVIIDSLGWVHYRLGNLAKAEEYLRRALSLVDDPEVAAHLGEVLWQAGKQEEARTVWQQALAKHPEHKTLLKVLQRFGP